VKIRIAQNNGSDTDFFISRTKNCFDIKVVVHLMFSMASIIDFNAVMNYSPTGETVVRPSAPEDSEAHGR